MRFWTNLIGYQLVWFAVVISAARERPGWGIAAALMFVAVQWWASPVRRADARVVGCALLLGIAVDGSLAASDLLRYAGAFPALIAPGWILALWAAFAMTVNHSMGFIRGRAGLAALLGAVGGPMAYLGAARGFGAVEFSVPVFNGLAALSVGWAIAMTVLMVLAGRWQRRNSATMATPRQVVR
ncbi:DUF2878 family protein [Lysobacter sp. F6437]|uniref:DUF2878 family protein n=1 Tax=Lysobacter sp. F6437 TaxID=3459296 RepID=UPI00403DA065